MESNLRNLIESYYSIYEEEEVELDEGMTMKDFKQQRSRQKQKEKRASDKIAPNRRKDIHTDRLSPERAARHRANVDPDFEGNDERNYPGGKLRAKKVRKAKALGELGEGVDIFDAVLEHLVSEGYADTNESALVIMSNMSEEWRQSIISEAPGEWFGGLRDRARASRASQMQSMQPTPKAGPSVSSPFAKPSSRTDSGRLTTYGAGGGSAAERAGQSRAQVMQQGAKNLENKKRTSGGPDPNFGR